MCEPHTVDDDLSRRVRSPLNTAQQVRTTDGCNSVQSEDFCETGSQLERSPSPPFQPHVMETLYPRQVQKHVNRKSLHMGRLLQSLRTPSKHACIKELRRMSELAKSQESSCRELFAYSARKQKRLLCQERGLQSELLQKGIDLDNPSLDIHNVFALPIRHKRYKQDPTQSASQDPETTPDPDPQQDQEDDQEEEQEQEEEEEEEEEEEGQEQNQGRDHDTMLKHRQRRKHKLRADWRTKEEGTQEWMWEPYAHQKENAEEEQEQKVGMLSELKDPESPEPKHVPRELTDSCYLLEPQEEFQSVSHFQIDDEPLSSFVPEAEVAGLFREIHNIRIDFPAEHSKAFAVSSGVGIEKMVEGDRCDFAKENVAGLPEDFDYTVTQYEPPPFAKAFSQEYK